ncbi:hypothetical protein BLNAU_15964 [Blattamonas nauphoetae]|uniref:Chorein N-terminal domain-containing protein n=1 Tax=Blattamonas nauphoetae TaxID=2049346 RepID=A0ABQ9X9H6_9EUKA|nr:hypothetical protein BLNAU_15964 [Blattamonas nauphoetae]
MISSFVGRYIAPYIRNYDKTIITASIVKGIVRIQNAELNCEFITSEFSLPFFLEHVICSSITIKFPISASSKTPIVITVDHVQASISLEPPPKPRPLDQILSFDAYTTIQANKKKGKEKLQAAKLQVEQPKQTSSIPAYIQKMFKHINIRILDCILTVRGAAKSREEHPVDVDPSPYSFEAKFPKTEQPPLFAPFLTLRLSDILLFTSDDHGNALSPQQWSQKNKRREHKYLCKMLLIKRFSISVGSFQADEKAENKHFSWSNKDHLKLLTHPQVVMAPMPISMKFGLILQRHSHIIQRLNLSTTLDTVRVIHSTATLRMDVRIVRSIIQFVANMETITASSNSEDNDQKEKDEKDDLSEEAQIEQTSPFAAQLKRFISIPSSTSLNALINLISLRSVAISLFVRELKVTFLSSFRSVLRPNISLTISNIHPMFSITVASSEESPRLLGSNIPKTLSPSFFTPFPSLSVNPVSPHLPSSLAAFVSAVDPAQPALPTILISAGFSIVVGSICLAHHPRDADPARPSREYSEHLSSLDKTDLTTHPSAHPLYSMISLPQVVLPHTQQANPLHLVGLAENHALLCCPSDLLTRKGKTIEELIAKPTPKQKSFGSVNRRPSEQDSDESASESLSSTKIDNHLGKTVSEVFTRPKSMRTRMQHFPSTDRIGMEEVNTHPSRFFFTFHPHLSGEEGFPACPPPNYMCFGEKEREVRKEKEERDRIKEERDRERMEHERKKKSFSHSPPSAVSIAPRTPPTSFQSRPLGSPPQPLPSVNLPPLRHSLSAAPLKQLQHDEKSHPLTVSVIKSRKPLTVISLQGNHKNGENKDTDSVLDQNNEDQRKEDQPAEPTSEDDVISLHSLNSQPQLTPTTPPSPPTDTNGDDEAITIQYIPHQPKSTQDVDLPRPTSHQQQLSYSASTPVFTQLDSKVQHHKGSLSSSSSQPSTQLHTSSLSSPTSQPSAQPHTTPSEPVHTFLHQYRSDHPYFSFSTNRPALLIEADVVRIVNAKVKEPKDEKGRPKTSMAGEPNKSKSNAPLSPSMPPASSTSYFTPPLLHTRLNANLSPIHLVTGAPTIRDLSNFLITSFTTIPEAEFDPVLAEDEPDDEEEEEAEIGDVISIPIVRVSTTTEPKVHPTQPHERPIRKIGEETQMSKVGKMIVNILKTELASEWNEKRVEIGLNGFSMFLSLVRPHDLHSTFSISTSSLVSRNVNSPSLLFGHIGTTIIKNKHSRLHTSSQLRSFVPGSSSLTHYEGNTDIICILTLPANSTTEWTPILAPSRPSFSITKDFKTDRFESFWNFDVLSISLSRPVIRAIPLFMSHLWESFKKQRHTLKEMALSVVSVIPKKEEAPKKEKKKLTDGMKTRLEIGLFNLETLAEQDWLDSISQAFFSLRTSAPWNLARAHHKIKLLLDLVMFARLTPTLNKQDTPLLAQSIPFLRLRFEGIVLQRVAVRGSAMNEQEMEALIRETDEERERRLRWMVEKREDVWGYTNLVIGIRFVWLDVKSCPSSPWQRIALIDTENDNNVVISVPTSPPHKPKLPQRYNPTKALKDWVKEAKTTQTDRMARMKERIGILKSQPQPIPHPTPSPMPKFESFYPASSIPSDLNLRQRFSFDPSSLHVPLFIHVPSISVDIPPDIFVPLASFLLLLLPAQMPETTLVPVPISISVGNLNISTPKSSHILHLSPATAKTIVEPDLAFTIVLTSNLLMEEEKGLWGIRSGIPQTVDSTMSIQRNTQSMPSTAQTSLVLKSLPSIHLSLSTTLPNTFSVSNPNTPSFNTFPSSNFDIFISTPPHPSFFPLFQPFVKNILGAIVPSSTLFFPLLSTLAWESTKRNGRFKRGFIQMYETHTVILSLPVQQPFTAYFLERRGEPLMERWDEELKERADALSIPDDAPPPKKEPEDLQQSSEQFEDGHPRDFTHPSVPFSEPSSLNFVVLPSRKLFSEEELAQRREKEMRQQARISAKLARRQRSEERLEALLQEIAEQKMILTDVKEVLEANTVNMEKTKNEMLYSRELRSMDDIPALVRLYMASFRSMI